MFYSPFYFDPTYVLILIGVALSLAASARLNATYATYSGIRSRSSDLSPGGRTAFALPGDL